MRLCAAATLLALALGACGDDDGASEPLVVSAASSLRTALTNCTNDGEDPPIRLSFAGSDQLAAQIRGGVRPDVYAAADRTHPEGLAKAGLLEQPVVFARNRLVVAIPADSEIATVDDLGEPGVRVVVGSESVPIGAYARLALARLGGERARRIHANVRSGEPDVSGIVGKLTQGAADAGFVYRTDVAASDGALRAVPLPDEADFPVSYSAGVVKGTEQRGDALAFVEGLRSGPCADALREAGFGRAPG